MMRNICFAFAVLQLAVFVNGNGHYTIVSPGTIRSNLKFNVAVSLHKDTVPSKLELVINGPSFNKTEVISLDPMTTKNVEFDIPKIEKGSYELSAKGLQGIEFTNSTKLNFAEQKPMSFIQTDKATYKPGDLVQFRVLFLDENTKPANIKEPVYIAITDAANNRIKQLNDIEITKGVYSGKLQLSEQPVLGKWKIEVSTTDIDLVKKDFEVAKYVLPKFEVTIDTAKDVSIADGSIKVTVRAKYTYGKPVKGTTTISIQPTYYYMTKKSNLMSKKTVPLDGKGHVEFVFGKDLFVESLGYIPALKILAIVTEELTHNQRNTTASIALHKDSFRFNVIDDPKVFVPGKPVKLSIAVTKLDGSPVLDDKNDVSLIIDYNGKDPLKFSAPLDKTGIAHFELVLPEPDFFQYSIQAQYLNTLNYVTSLNKYASKPTLTDIHELEIKVLTEKPRFGKPVAFEVISGVALPYFVYTLVGRGSIIKMEHVIVPENEKSAKIKFTPTIEMIPKVNLFVYFLNNNDLIFKEATIDFGKDFGNSIEISAPLSAKPGEDVELQVHTDPDSYVGLLGVDQSVLLLKTGNDFEKDSIVNALQKFDAKTPRQSGFGPYPGRQSGLVTMTNAHFPFELPRVLYSLAGGLQVDYFAAGMANMKSAYFHSPAFAMKVRPGLGALPSIVPAIRKDFSENWIFYDQPNSENGSFSLKQKIPDTITSWVVTGFSLSPKTGIALTENPSKIRVFQPFFISTNLPYSVKRGEVIAIPVVVFNYMEKALDTEVTMENMDKEYDFTEATNDIEENPINEIRRIKRLVVPPNTGSSVSFMIRPNKVGEITLKITAISPLAGDTVHKSLKVEPEGVTKFGNQAVFVSLDDQTEFTGKFSVDLPSEVVPDSEFIELSVVGDLLGPTMKHLDGLVKMPYGCGEQNMVNFVPNILVLNYIKVAKKHLPKIEEKAKKYIEVGYQRELTYKRYDGSYSAFGKADKHGSTWLTAYVVRFFDKATLYTDIDPQVIKNAYEFLAAKQDETGKFTEQGKLFDYKHQSDLVLTSFVLLAFAENKETAEKYADVIQKASQYIVKAVDDSDDIYALALAANALTAVKHVAADKVLAKLELSAQEDNGMKWWSKAKKETEKTSTNYNDVEITAYVVMSLLKTKPTTELIPILKWLVSKRNANGGFVSSQDTVVGLMALTSFSSSGHVDMKIDFSSSNDKEVKGSFEVNPENLSVLQSFLLPKSTRSIDFQAAGKGSASLQFSYRYNVADKDKKPSFAVTTKVKNNTPKGLLKFDVCAEFLSKNGEKDKDSNMAVLEVGLPSGFIADTEKLDDILAVERVKRTETKNSDSIIIVYFDGLTPNDVKCVPVAATKAHAVAKQKPAAISVYDYYEPDVRATEFYEHVTSLCDICEGDDCGAGCKKP